MSVNPPGAARPNSTGTGWTVTSQTEGPVIGPNGKAVLGVTVNFVTAKGVHGSVFVATDQYTALNVRAAIAARAAALDEVQGMQG